MREEAKMSKRNQQQKFKSDIEGQMEEKRGKGSLSNSPVDYRKNFKYTVDDALMDK